MVSSELPPLENYAIGLMVFGALFCLLNLTLAVASVRSGRFVSMIPLVGGLTLAGGALLLPATRPFAVLGLVLDLGTLTFLLAIPRIAHELWSTSRFNLLEEYRRKKENHEVILRLYREQICILQQFFRREPAELGIRHISLLGSWERDGTRIVLQLGGKIEVLEAVPESRSLKWRGLDARYDPSLADIELELTYQRSKSKRFKQVMPKHAARHWRARWRRPD